MTIGEVLETCLFQGLTGLLR
ncbi:MAG: hypothetical protein RL563_2457, partial [Pseudomonadota bacterium]